MANSLGFTLNVKLLSVMSMCMAVIVMLMTVPHPWAAGILILNILFNAPLDDPEKYE